MVDMIPMYVLMMNLVPVLVSSQIYEGHRSIMVGRYSRLKDQHLQRHRGVRLHGGLGETGV